MEPNQPVSMATELTPASQYSPIPQTYPQNQVVGNTDGQSFNPIPVYQQTYTTPQQLYGPQDMNHNIPNYSQDISMDPFKPQYEYGPVSQSHQNLIYSNTDSGLGYESNNVIYNGDVSMNYYNTNSGDQFANSQSIQAGNNQLPQSQATPPVKRGPGRPSKKVFLPNSKEKSYVCEVCYKPLGTYQSLRKHMVVHTGERMYKCHICSNSYTQKHNLTKHLLVHSGERPYMCRHCPAAFRTSHLLKSHSKKHQKKRGSYVKELDDKSNDSEMMDTSLDQNDSSHETSTLTDTSSGMNSPVNEKSASPDSGIADSLGSPVIKSDKLETALLNQSEIHKEIAKELDKQDCKAGPQAVTQDKVKLECNQCDQTFESRVKLMRHKNEHNSLKTLSCIFCNATFRWKASLDIHMRKHKGQKQPSYELKGLKIKNGNRITLKIVNSDKKIPDSEKKIPDLEKKIPGSDTLEKTPDTTSSLKKTDIINTKGQQDLKKIETSEKIPTDESVPKVDKKMEVQQSICNIKLQEKLSEIKDDDIDDEPTKTENDGRNSNRKTSNRKHVENPYVGSMAKSEIATPSENQSIRASSRIQKKTVEKAEENVSDETETKPTKGRKFECDSCGQKFTQSYSLKRHKSNKICTR